MAFKRGVQAAQEQAEKQKAARGGGFDKVQYLQLKDGESELVRPLHDGDAWYYYQWHGYLPMRPPSDEWPSKVREYYISKTRSATCQKDENIGSEFCFACDKLHEFKPNEKTKNYKRVADRGRYVARQRYVIPVLLRQEILVTQEMIDSGEAKKNVMRNGKEVSNLNRLHAVVDQTEEGDLRDPETGEKTGKRGQIPMIRLIEHPYDTSIAGLTAEYLDSEDRTVLDRDFKLTRSGAETDTKYLWTSRKPIKYRTEESEELVWDLGDPDLFATYKPYIPDVEKVITERATDEYYDKFFNPEAPFAEYEPDEDEDTGKGGLHVVKDTEPDPDAEAKQEALAKVRAEVMEGFKRPAKV